MEAAELAARVADVARLEGEFVLRSGRTATEYFDKYQFEADPVLLAEIAKELEPLVPEGTEVLAGLELGGVPIAVALGLRTGIPMAFVRKVSKEYGTARLAEGAGVEGRRLLVVEDVVTSGGQLLDSVRQLRRRGAVVEEAVCVIDRQEGGVEALASRGVRLGCLFTRSGLA